MKIIHIIGARPQFIKVAPLSRLLQKEDGIEEVIVHTGQHFDDNMSTIFFDEMKIPKPNYNLQVHSVSHVQMISGMMNELEPVLLQEQPDLVLVYGDTNTTFSGAMVANKLKIKLGHVEAGIRSFNMSMVEEVNRILTDRISDICFCPSSVAMDNLKNEGFEQFNNERHFTGDVTMDAAKLFSDPEYAKPELRELNAWKNYVLCTFHRAENTDEKISLSNIVNCLNKIAQDQEIVLPLHPRTKKKIEEHGLKLEFETIEPVGYLQMLDLIQNASLILTDSGGLQKDAYFFGKKCITMRPDTEWPELIKEEANVLVDSDPEKIMWAYQMMQNKDVDFGVDFFKAGEASKNIIDIIKASDARF